MPIPILMPALSPTMETGTLAKWLVKVGDTVASGDVLAEIETDKATMEVESIDEGRVAKIFVAEGTEGVPVNQLIAVLLEEGEDDSALEGFDAGGAAAPVTPAKAEAPAEVTEEPAAQKAAPAVAATASVALTKSSAKVFASPLARRLAKQGNLDLAKISGSGPNGRIVKRDIEAAVASGGATISTASAAPSAAVLAAGPSDQAILALYEEGSYEVVPHDGMRKIIAQRLQESKQTVPHFYLTVDCELDALLAIRKRMNDRSPKELLRLVFCRLSPVVSVPQLRLGAETSGHFAEDVGAAPRSPLIQSAARCPAPAAATTRRLSSLSFFRHPLMYAAACSIVGGLIPAVAHRKAEDISATSSSFE